MTETVVLTIPSPVFSPSETARLELIALTSRQEFCRGGVFGSHMPSEMIEENKRKDQAYRAARLEIIKKHGVAEEYLKPLLEEEKRLQGELARVQREIAELRHISDGT
jgi:uncharacterized protein YydD (DUF2326 family)